MKPEDFYVTCRKTPKNGPMNIIQKMRLETYKERQEKIKQEEKELKKRYIELDKSNCQLLRKCMQMTRVIEEQIAKGEIRGPALKKAIPCIGWIGGQTRIETTNNTDYVDMKSQWRIQSLSKNAQERKIKLMEGYKTLKEVLGEEMSDDEMPKLESCYTKSIEEDIKDFPVINEPSTSAAASEKPYKAPITRITSSTTTKMPRTDISVMLTGAGSQKKVQSTNYLPEGRPRGRPRLESHLITPNTAVQSHLPFGGSVCRVTKPIIQKRRPGMTMDQVDDPPALVKVKNGPPPCKKLVLRIKKPIATKKGVEVEMEVKSVPTTSFTVKEPETMPILLKRQLGTDESQNYVESFQNPIAKVKEEEFDYFSEIKQEIPEKNEDFPPKLAAEMSSSVQEDEDDSQYLFSFG